MSWLTMTAPLMRPSASKSGTAELRMVLRLPSKHWMTIFSLIEVSPLLNARAAAHSSGRISRPLSAH